MTAEPLDPSVMARYETSFASGRSLTRLYPFTALALVIVVAGLVRGVQETATGLAALLILVGIVGLVWYSVLTRVCLLELTAGTLRWRSRLRSGEVPVTELRRVRLAGQTSQTRMVAIITCDREHLIRVAVTVGFRDFVAALKQAAPQLDVSLPQAAAPYPPAKGA
jgi:hypothetical protein